MDPLLNQTTPDRNPGRDDALERTGPSLMLRIISITVILAMLLASASVIIAMTDLGVRLGLVIFVAAFGIAGLLVWRWNRQDRHVDGDNMDSAS